MFMNHLRTLSEDEHVLYSFTNRLRVSPRQALNLAQMAKNPLTGTLPSPQIDDTDGLPTRSCGDGRIWGLR
jgi:hypothetical protein